MKPVTAVALLLALVPSLRASDVDPKMVDAALNKVDVGFFLLLDKKEEAKAQEKAHQDALNKVDVGFFLLLDKKEEAEKAKATEAKRQQALNKVDVGFFLLLDKKEQEKARAEALNKVDVGFFLLLDRKESGPASEVELGRQLFFDPRLSGNKTMSCASCHNPSMAWTDGLPRARGLNSAELSRNTPTLLNVHHSQQRFFWDGRVDSVEAATLTALQSRLEMNRDPQELVLELNRIPDYARQFVDIYGLAGVTPEHIGKAIASFVRQLYPGESAFDRFRQDRTAMGEDAQRGLQVFTEKGRCVLCHTGPGFSDSFFHNTGLKPLAGVSDLGRSAIEPGEQNHRAFKTVPLRNVALTAPYMHDGSLATLREVVEFYDRGGDVKGGRDMMIQPLGLSAQEKQDLLAFLGALTGEQKPVPLPVLPRELGPASAEQAALWSQQRLKMIAYNVKGQDLKGLRANAVAFQETLAALRSFLPEGPTAPCVEASGRAAETLAEAAGAGKDWTQLKAAAAGLSRAAASCGPKPSGTPLSEADRLIAQAEGMLRGPKREPRSYAAPEEACRAGFSMAGLVKDIGQAKYSSQDDDMIRNVVMDDALRYYQYKAFAAKDPAVCDQMGGLQKKYFGITRTAAWGCREWYWDMASANALTTKDPKFESICRNSFEHDYPHMKAEDGKFVCAAIASNINDPVAACSQLIPRYLGEETRGACLNELSRYSRNADVGKTQANVPDMLFNRYVALDLYTRAYAAKDIGVCGESEACRVLMGKGDAIAQTYAANVGKKVCEISAKNAPAAPEQTAAALLDQSERLLSQAESARGPEDFQAARSIDALGERIARLRRAGRPKGRAGPSGSR